MKLLLSFVLAIALAQNTLAARERFSHEGIDFSVAVPEPEQMVAFYSARGFPPAAIEEIRRTCYLGVGVFNKSDKVVWLELANWRIEDESGQPVQRITREQWNQIWERLNVPLASRATFGWTQMPESRDLQPQEPVGGNLAVISPNKPFKLIARFRTGADGKGEPIEMQVDKLQCPEVKP